MATTGYKLGTKAEQRDRRRVRLMQTASGRALQLLLDEHGGVSGLSAASNISAVTIAWWIQMGEVSRNGALALAANTGRTKEELRPDISEEDWKKGIPGRKTGMASKSQETCNADILIIEKLVARHGSMSSAANILGVSENTLSTWKSRGSIPTNCLKTLVDAL